MSATTASQATPQAPHLDIGDTGKIPFARLVKVELRKSYDTRAGFWLLATIAGLVLLAEAIVTIVLIVQDEQGDWGGFIAVAAYLTGFLLPVLGILLVTSEWGQRTAMVTFAIEPRRSLVILAKLVVGLLLALATAAVAIAVGAICTAICALAGNEVSWEFGWNYFFGFIVTQSLAMIGGFALAALLLNTAAAIVLFFVYKWVLLYVFAIASFYLSWFDSASQWFDFQRAQGPLYDMSIHTAGEWGHLIVSGLIWLGLPLAIGLWRILHAEVK